jgi:hypothetical protein
MPTQALAQDEGDLARLRLFLGRLARLYGGSLRHLLLSDVGAAHNEGRWHVIGGDGDRDVGEPTGCETVLILVSSHSHIMVTGVRPPGSGSSGSVTWAGYVGRLRDTRQMSAGSIITFRVVQRADQECAWQQSSEISVAHMVNPWRYAQRRRNRQPRWDDLMMLGVAVEPRKNFEGIRKIGPGGLRGQVGTALVPDALHHGAGREVSLPPEVVTQLKASIARQVRALGE